MIEKSSCVEAWGKQGGGSERGQKSERRERGEGGHRWNEKFWSCR